MAKWQRVGQIERRALQSCDFDLEATGRAEMLRLAADFKEMGIEGAAAQVLVEGLTAHPGSARLLELASGKAVAQPPELPQASAYPVDRRTSGGTGKSGIDSLPETKTGTVIVDEDDTEASSSIFPSGSPAAPARSMSSSSASLPRDIIFTLQGKWQVRLAPLSTRDAKQHSDGHGAFYGHSSGSSITSGPSNFTLGYATCILSGEPCSLDDRVRPPSPLPALWCLLHHLMPKGVCFGDRIDLPPAECFAKNFCLCPCLQSPQQLILAPPSCCDNDSRL
eukprot:s3709_g7.t1